MLQDGAEKYSQLPHNDKNIMLYTRTKIPKFQPTLPCKCPGGKHWRGATPAETTDGLETAGGNVLWKLTATPPSGETILPATTGLQTAGCETNIHHYQPYNRLLQH
jgi:hypothetical protein